MLICFFVYSRRSQIRNPSNENFEELESALILSTNCEPVWNSISVKEIEINNKDVFEQEP